MTAFVSSASEFSGLFEEHADAIYGFCFRRTADWALAEDLTAAVFLEAWRRRESVDLESDPALPWLYGVANNLLRNHRRSLRRHRAALARIPAADPEHFADDADSRLDDARAMRELLGEVRALPQRELEVLTLVAWAELTYEETAQALGVPVGTVRSRLSRARSRLGPASHVIATAEGVTS